MSKLTRGRWTQKAAMVTNRHTIGQLRGNWKKNMGTWNT